MTNYTIGVVGEMQGDVLKRWAAHRGATIKFLELDENGAVDCVVFDDHADSEAYFLWIQSLGSIVHLQKKN